MDGLTQEQQLAAVLLKDEIENFFYLDADLIDERRLKNG
jgi:hypothetical protein